MKRFYVYIAIIMVAFSCIGFMNFAHANEGIGLDIKYITSKTELPAGPTPSNPNNYKYFNFGLEFHDLADNEYYKITASLNSSRYDGTMANYGSHSDEDLKFHSRDYIGQYALLRNMWDYEGVSALSKELGSDANTRSVPSLVYIRCYDWGAHGDLTVTLYRKNPNTGAYDIEVDSETVTIPYDGNNNNIADAWQRDGNRIHNGQAGWRPGIDDESLVGNNWPGDGWSVYDEYRGLWSGSSHFRLNPNYRDVIVAYDSGMQNYAGGDGTIRYHSLHTVDGSYIRRAWENIHVSDSRISTAVHEDVGWVNFNSAGVSGDRIPGYNRVWAIRVETRGTHSTRPRVLGNALIGSPGRSSKILIFADANRNYVTKRFNERRATYRNTAVGFNYTSAEVNASVDMLIRRVVSHELGHTLNLSHAPNTDRSDIMHPTTGFSISIINRVIQLWATTFNNAYHLDDWAATGTPAGGGSSNAEAPDPSLITDIDIPTDYIPPDDTPTNPPSSTPPSAPTGVTVTHGDGNVSLSWTSPTDTGSSDITDYEYSYREASGGTWSDWESAETTGNSAYIDDLTNGVLYEFIVRAVTADGYSESSVSVSGTSSTIPDAPTSLNATGYNGYVNLSWYGHSSNGGSEITNYEIAYGQSGGSFGSWYSTYSTSTSSNVYYLTNGTQYKFKVRAVNINGVSSESSTEYGTPIGVPSAPSNFTATGIDGGVDLSWEDPLYNNGSTISGFEYSYRQGSGGYFHDWTSVGYSHSASITGLINGTYYEFRVRALSSSGSGDRAGPIGATPESSGTVPDAPTGIGIVGLSGGTAILYWSRPASDIEENIDDYEYSYRESGGTWSSWSSSSSYPYAYAYITGLSVGTTYEFKSRAVNAYGQSSESSIVSLTPAASVPDAPTGLSGSYESTGHIYLSWNTPDDGGSSITGYEFRYKQSGSSWSGWSSTGGWGTRSSVRLRGISAGTEYSFQVRALNSIGSSSSSNTATVSTQ